MNMTLKAQARGLDARIVTLVVKEAYLRKKKLSTEKKALFTA